MPSTVAFAPPNQPPAAESRRQAAPEAGEFKPFGADGLTFGDILDVLNPLQHLPIVGSIYRAITGDTISAASKVTGGALFGGLIGFAAAVADTVLQESSGKDAGAHVMALMRDARSQSEGSREPPWSKTASLRHDANEHDDGWWQDPDGAAGTKNVAATGNTDMAARGDPARGSEFQAAQTAALRHDANEHDDGWWQDPDTTSNAENVAAAQQSASAAPAAASPVAGIPARNAPRPSPTKVAAPAAIHRVGPGAALDGGPRAIAGALPPPQALAANSAMVTAMRNGESRYFRPGGTINTDAWLKLMSNVSANRGPNATPTGAPGLASATLAKALASYGAAQAIAAQAGKGSARP